MIFNFMNAMEMGLQYLDVNVSVIKVVTFTDDPIPDIEELLYQLSGVSPLRVYLSAGLDPPTAQTLQDMRPSPSFYVLLGSTTAVNNMFNSVSFVIFGH